MALLRGINLGSANSLPAKDATRQLAPYCKNGERITIVGGAIWIDFPEGVARSKLSPAVLDRVIGSTVTMRNWKTVQAIAAMLGG